MRATSSTRCAQVVPPPRSSTASTSTTTERRPHEADRRSTEAQGSRGHGSLMAARPKPAPAEVPHAVAIVMDGNGRWAAGHGVSVAEGHRAGSRALRPVVETAIDVGVESLAVYAFSTENWTRSADEVSALMDIFGETIDRELHDLAKEGVRTQFVGRRDRAPDWLQTKMRELEDATAGETRLNLWI